MRHPYPVLSISCIVLVLGCMQDWDSLEPDGTGGSTGGSSGGSTAGSAGATGGSSGGSTGGSAGATGGSSGSAGATPACNDPGGLVWDENGHCYFPLNPEDDWASHRDGCEAEDAHLVTITSQAEQLFVQEILANESRWIGLSSSGNTFGWVNGEDYDFTNWMQGEPNEGPGVCVRLRENGLWTDRSCDLQYRGICERE